MVHRAFIGIPTLVLVLAAAACNAASASNPNTPAQPPNGASGGCEQEIALQCSAGMVDGCLQKTAGGQPLTTAHACVPPSETGGPPCAQELAKLCGEGLVDACLVNPPLSSQHVCVAKPTP